MSYKKIILPAGSALPLQTAARELAEATGATVANRPHEGKISAGEIALALGEAARSYTQARDLFEKISGEREWELVKSAGGGLLIAGSSPRGVCRAALAWIADPESETNRVSSYRFRERFTMWDTTLNQWYRNSKGFDRARHIREIARLGHTGVEINRYPDPEGWHVRHRKFPNDSYAWYLNYCPALDAFVESSLTRGFYPAEELARNLADLEEAAGLARSYGLAPGFVCYEPRCVNEKIFDKYPQLRGSRTDHPGRSLEPRYALDIANPRVLEHYAESLTNLMQRVPDLRYLVFWTGDSGSGLPFAKNLYFGPNGSYLAKSKTTEQMAAEFSGALLEAGRRINPEFEVLMEISWEYTEEERKLITAALPEGVNLTHPSGGGMGFLGGTEKEVHAEWFEDDRKAGKEPFGEIVVSNWWDFEPVFGIPCPAILKDKFDVLNALELKQFFSRGSIISPPQCPYDINNEVYSQLIRREGLKDLHAFLLQRARDWCGGEKRQAELLVKAWLSGEEALKSWPVLNWYQAGAGPTQGRWITRPLVPDFSRLDKSERAAFERGVFTLEWDIGRQNLVFEGGLRQYTEDQLDQAVEKFDESMLPLLELTVGILEQALELGKCPVIEDQRDRYRGLLLLNRTVRNGYAAQSAINRYLLDGKGREIRRKELDQALRAEIANTRDWIKALKTSRTIFFHTTELEETPFLYKSPVEDLELRLAVMERHIGDPPGPDLPELRAEHGERSAWRKRD